MDKKEIITIIGRYPTNQKMCEYYIHNYITGRLSRGLEFTSKLKKNCITYSKASRILYGNN